MDAHNLIKDLLQFVNEHPWVSTALLALGSFSVARVVYQTLSVLLQTFVLPGKSLKTFGASKGAWAVVTGASDGIGKEFALQLAKAGFNVFIVARSQDRLNATTAEITQKYAQVTVQSHTIDFAKADDAAYGKLSTALSGLDIGVLVNNVGKSHSMPVNFAETPMEELVDIPAINVNATLRVTHTILPGMVERKRGLILNLGSFAGAVPSPMLATYSGTKAFLATFSSALAAEVKSHGIVVEHLNTYFVVSKLSKIRRASMTTPTPAAYVRSVLSKIGLACGASYSGRPNTSTPYWSHAVVDYTLTALGVRDKLAISFTHSLHKDIRRRALKKQEREAKAQ